MEMIAMRLCLLYVAVSFVAFTQGRNEGFELLKQGVVEHFTSKTSETLVRASRSYKLPHVLNAGMEKAFDNKEICELCNVVVDVVIDERKAGMSRDAFVALVEAFCIYLNIEAPRVCQGGVELNADYFIYIIDHKHVTAEDICGSILQNFQCPTGLVFDWAIDIPAGNSRTRPELDIVAASSFSVLQLSDIHYDPYYTPNSQAVCAEPVCCQSDQGTPTDGEAGCGYWTDYRDADTPWHLVEETIRQVKTHDFDYVYYTGDIISHRVWQTTVENNTQTISKMYRYFNDSFNVPVFPIFGNHEPHPLNVWPDDTLQDSRLSVNWLFELAAKEWSDLIGEDVSETVLKGGYYTISPKPGFRIVAVNSNLCYTVNWWLIFNNVDPFGQLQWLADTLKKAEDANESVHILTHIPTGDISCLRVWSREYRKIIERFSNTITGQFNGHTHRDEFHVYYNKSEPTQAVGVAFNGASVTPYSNSNPSYKIYRVDSSNFALLDYEEWTFNLTLANSQPTRTPDWYRLYSFVQAYGVANLQPREVGKVLYKMAEDHTLVDDYFRFYSRSADPEIKDGCDEACRKEYLCDIAKAEFGDNTQCDFFTELYEKAKNGRNI